MWDGDSHAQHLRSYFRKIHHNDPLLTIICMPNFKFSSKSFGGSSKSTEGHFTFSNEIPKEFQINLKMYVGTESS